MEKLRYSEIFYSVQGEGRFVGVPSVFFRVFGCNFNCHGFGQGRDETKWLKPEEMPYMTQDLSHVKHVRDLPVVEIGCDASASWSSRYKNLVAWEGIDDIAQRITAYTPNNTWTNNNGTDIHFIITGGEPMLWQRETQILLRQPEFNSLKNLTIETNCTQLFKAGFDKFLQGLVAGDYTKEPVHITWSTSPKLSISGEKWDKAIKPEVVAEYKDTRNLGQLKFVMGHKDREWEELDTVIAQFRDVGVDWPIWIMPVGAREEEQNVTAGEVARKAFQRGYNVAARVHVYLFGNAIGT